MAPPSPTLSIRDIEERGARLGPYFHNINLLSVPTAPHHFLGDYPSSKWKPFTPSLPPDLRGWTILDIGCNAGFYSLESVRRGASRVVAIDTHERYLAQARLVAEIHKAHIELHQLSVAAEAPGVRCVLGESRPSTRNSSAQWNASAPSTPSKPSPSTASPSNGTTDPSTIGRQNWPKSKPSPFGQRAGTTA